MGVDLVGHGGASFNWSAWRSSLQVAEAFGWHAAGTIMPHNEIDRIWEGGYFSNDCQEVTDDDAHALGLAIHRAVTALRTGQKLTEEQANACTGVNITALCEVGDYALQGGFAIY